MAVDDAELLALAGGDSSDEETPQQTTLMAKAASPLPSIEISQTDARIFSASQAKPSSVPKARVGSHKAVKKARRDDSEEEGEASSASASPDSLQSAPMSESDSDSSPGDDAASAGHPFPVDGQFHSEKDKKEIMSLPEIERESILAERAQILERKLQDQHLRRLLQAREIAEAKIAEKKRKAGADLEDSPRKSSRQKTTLGGRRVGETSGAIEAYKRQREQKGLRDEQRRREGANRKERRARSSSGGKYSSADADGDSEVEWDDGKAKADDYRLRNAQPADFNDFRRTTFIRHSLADYCFYPGFEEVIKDCYVRVPVPATPATREMTYQLLLVKGIIEKRGWDYAVEKMNAKRFVTNQHLLLAVDGNEKEFHFNAISNSAVTEVEVANYKNSLANEGKTLPTHPFLSAKIDEIHALIGHQFTDEELQMKLQRSGAIQNRFAPLERIGIANRRRAAEERGDEATIAKCDAELAELDGPKLKYGTFLVNPKAQNVAPAEPSQQDRLAELNRSNRKKNSEDVRKAQLAEKRVARLARQAFERGEAVQDPLARVKTLSKTHYDVNETLAPHRARLQANSRDVSRAGTPGGASTPKPEPTVIPSPERKPLLTASGLPILSSRNMDDEIIGAMDMGIDIEI